MELLKDLSFFVLSMSIFSFILVKAHQKIKEEKMKEKINEWWKTSKDEEDFLKKFETFLEIYFTPRTEKNRRKAYAYLKKIQVILQKNYLREEKISHDLYERLLNLIEAKQL